MKSLVRWILAVGAVAFSIHLILAGQWWVVVLAFVLAGFFIWLDDMGER